MKRKSKKNIDKLKDSVKLTEDIEMDGLDNVMSADDEFDDDDEDDEDESITKFILYG